MMNENSLEIQKAVLLARIDELPGTPDADFAARRLELMCWQPSLLFQYPGFARITSDLLRTEVHRLFAMDSSEILEESGIVGMFPDRIRSTQASMLVAAAELLWRLRCDEPEAWDVVNELYEDD